MKPALFSLQDISLMIPGIDKSILSNISYSIFPEDFIILLGSNGSGKSSLLKLLDKRYQPSTGKIYFNGKNISEYSSKHLAPAIKTLTQNCNESLFSSLTLLENYLLVKQQQESNLFSFKEKHDRNFLGEYLQSFNPNLSVKLDQTVDKLSGGEKQAFALAMMVVYPPKVLLLDEHTSALDPKTAEQLMSLTHHIITQHKITCLLTTHDLEIAEKYGNRVLALQNGKTYRCLEQHEKSNVTQQHLFAECY